MSIWRRNFAFGLLAPKDTTVPFNDIVECSVSFPAFSHDWGRVPHFAIALFAREMLEQTSLQFPDILQDDETGDESDAACRFWQEGIQVITTFKYETKPRTATFWLRRDLAADVQKEQVCSVAVLRTDTWQIIPKSTTPAAPNMRISSAWL